MPRWHLLKNKNKYPIITVQHQYLFFQDKNYEHLKIPKSNREPES